MEAAVRTAYQRMSDAGVWEGPVIEPKPDGTIPINAILARFKGVHGDTQQDDSQEVQEEQVREEQIRKRQRNRSPSEDGTGNPNPPFPYTSTPPGGAITQEIPEGHNHPLRLMASSPMNTLHSTPQDYPTTCTEGHNHPVRPLYPSPMNTLPNTPQDYPTTYTMPEAITQEICEGHNPPAGLMDPSHMNTLHNTPQDHPITYTMPGSFPFELPYNHGPPVWAPQEMHHHHHLPAGSTYLPSAQPDLMLTSGEHYNLTGYDGLIGGGYGSYHYDHQLNPSGKQARRPR
ncbi:MAG: hypothetical protein Q9221_005215 [Calogaya cf. arnoldii]